MQPFLTKTLLSMLEGSFHLACKVTLTSRREAILPSPLYILPNTTQRYYFVISLNAPRALFCADVQVPWPGFPKSPHTGRRRASSPTDTQRRGLTREHAPQIQGIPPLPLAATLHFYPPSVEKSIDIPGKIGYNKIKEKTPADRRRKGNDHRRDLSWRLYFRHGEAG